MSDTVRIQGKAFSWGSVIYKADGHTYTGHKSITWSHKRERVAIYPANAEQMATAVTRGKYSVGDIKIAMRVESAMLLKERLAAKSTDGKSYGDPLFPMLLQYVEGAKLPVKVDFRNAWVVSVDGNETEGPDGSYQDVTFGCLKILENGLTLAASARR